MIIVTGSWFEGITVRIEPCGPVEGLAVLLSGLCFIAPLAMFSGTGPSILHSRLSIPREGILSYLLLRLLSSPVHKKVPWDASRNIYLIIRRDARNITCFVH